MISKNNKEKEGKKRKEKEQPMIAKTILLYLPSNLSSWRT